MIADLLQHRNCAYAARRLTLFASLLCIPAARAQPAFVPDDPYYFPNPTNTSYSQWYLNCTGTTAVVDINVAGAWARGLTGQGVKVGVVDAAVEYTHPDLLANYNAADSWDFYNGDPDPFPDPNQPTLTRDTHGSCVTGLLCARGGNGIGITGVAPLASFASLRAIPPSGSWTLDDATAWQRLAGGERYHSSGTNTNIVIKNSSFGEGPGLSAIYYGQIAALDQAVVESTQAGTIHVAGAGNGRLWHGGAVPPGDGEANRKVMTHLSQSISIAAVNSQGVFAEYSCWGACVAACTPSGETVWNGGVSLITTDRTSTNGYNPNRSDVFPNQDYTSMFSGTSSSAPLMSGVLALAKQAQPNLDTRMAKHLLARTCALIDPADATPMGGWITNAAGYHFNNNYGFGLVDADALTLAAVQCSGVTPLVTRTTGLISVGKTKIPIGTEAGVTQAVVVATSGPLEEVCVRLIVNPEPMDLDGLLYGQLELVAISPTGTRSLMAYRNSGSQMTVATLDWAYTSHAFWGEEAAGTWTITLSHPNLGLNFDHNYFWDKVEIITRSGELIPAAPSLVVLTNFSVVSNHFAFTVTGPAAQTVAIETSPDLSTWTALQTNTLTGGTFAFTDPDPASSTNRFYRARSVNTTATLTASKSASKSPSPASWRVIWPAGGGDAPSPARTNATRASQPPSATGAFPIPGAGTLMGSPD